MSTVLKGFGWVLILLSPIGILDSAVAMGVLIALGGLFINQAQIAEEVKVKQSQSYLDSCVKAFEEARSLLIDGNNERATWIAAGRALMLAKEFSNGVTVWS